MSPHTFRRRRPRLAVLAGTVATAFALALVAGCGGDDESVAVVDQAVAAEHDDHGTVSPAIHTEAGHQFQDDMRKLWEDHVTWTRLAIVSYIDDLSDLEPTVARLIQNDCYIVSVVGASGRGDFLSILISVSTWVFYLA